MYFKLKRILDFLASLIGLTLLSLILLVISLAICIDSKGPIIFKQKRVGKGKKYFNMYKFRTMHVEAPSDTPTHLFKDFSKYTTKVGRFLRKSSLDELPQLFNILKGDMSIVGPRPALWNQYDLIEERDNYNANDIRPGLTGWAQVNGRDELEIPAKAKYDGYYASNVSLSMDIKCFWRTLIAVLKSDGVVEGDSRINKKGRN